MSLSDFMIRITHAIRLDSFVATAVAKRYPLIPSAGLDYVHALAARLFDRTDGRVFAGPFAEMRLAKGSHLASYPFWIVGCYEEELHSSLSEVICVPPKLIVDIGSAHGYYVVGLANTIQRAKIIGFEACPNQHWEQAAELAALNGVGDRIQQHGNCTIEALNDVLCPHSVILCDCEGAEVELLDPSRVPHLKSARVLCELHDFFRRGVTQTLVGRFAQTHDISILYETKRDPDRYRILNGLSAADKYLAVTEPKFIDRGVTSARFIWMTPRSKFSSLQRSILAWGDLNTLAEDNPSSQPKH